MRSFVRLFVLGGAAVLAFGSVGSTDSAAAEAVEIVVPEGVLPPEIPEDNPVTEAKVALGRKLYFDTRISTDGTVSCSTCHDPRHGFADGRGDKTSKGVSGQLGTRNSPTVLNAAFLSDQFWDGRADTLEEQAKQPIANPVEHGFKDQAAVAAKLQELKADYESLFAAAFGSNEITVERFAQAVASFERTIVSLDAPIDRFIAGDKKAISESAQRGWELYNGKARCNTCHGHVGAFPLFTDEDYHNLGVGTEKIDFEDVARKGASTVTSGKDIDTLVLTNVQASELGRFIITKEPKHIGAFKTPQLRNIALTAPYMHDGSEPTLEKVMDLYNRGGNPNPYLDGGMRPLNLTPQEITDVVELMKTFTSSDLKRFDDLQKEMAGR